MSLATVRLFREYVGDRMIIVGAGGVSSGADAYEYLLAGASAVQIGTAFNREGASLFDRVATQLSGILERKRYSNATDVVGRLRVSGNDWSALWAARGNLPNPGAR